jgi:prophage antirepressor-like protein
MEIINVNDWALVKKDVNDEPWITGEELGRHLGYADPRRSVNNLFNKHRDKFKDDYDYSVIDLVTERGARKTTIFSERGALKIIRHSNTEVSNEIMDQVFDVFLAARKKVSQKYDDHPMVKMTRDFLKMEDEQQAQAIELAVHKCKIEIMEAKQEAILGQSGFYSILAYANLSGRKVTIKEAAALGRKAAKLSKDLGYTVGSVPDPRFGVVGVYHKDILNGLFNES